MEMYDYANQNPEQLYPYLDLMNKEQAGQTKLMMHFILMNNKNINRLTKQIDELNVKKKPG